MSLPADPPPDDVHLEPWQLAAARASADAIRANADMLRRLSVNTTVREFIAPSAGLPADAPPAPALRLEVRGEAVYLDGEPVRLDLGPEARPAVIAYLRRLVADPTAWVSGQDVGADCMHVRWDRLFKKLPLPLLELIEAKAPNGRRLAAAAWRH
jgi:hypothetical protein